jgi:hypothetical protein
MVRRPRRIAPQSAGRIENARRRIAAMMRTLWDRVWFSDGSAVQFRAVRVILALQSLWILLSRPDIPQLASWPHAFFTAIPTPELRFGFGALPPAAEWMLFAALHAILIAVIVGRWTRPLMAVAGLLLYHFAPFEEMIVGGPHTFFGGLTVPAVGFLVLAFAEVPKNEEWSPEYRWPVAVVELLFSFNYFCAALAKFRFSGRLWFTATNIRNWVVENWAWTHAPWTLTVAASPVLCWGIAISTLVVEFFFPLVLVSRTARRILVPMAFLGHIGIVYTLGISFPSLPLLLLFINWEWLRAWIRGGRLGGSAAAVR